MRRQCISLITLLLVASTCARKWTETTKNNEITQVADNCDWKTDRIKEIGDPVPTNNSTDCGFACINKLHPNCTHFTWKDSNSRCYLKQAHNVTLTESRNNLAVSTVTADELKCGFVASRLKSAASGLVLSEFSRVTVSAIAMTVLIRHLARF